MMLLYLHNNITLVDAVSVDLLSIRGIESVPTRRHIPCPEHKRQHARLPACCRPIQANARRQAFTTISWLLSHNPWILQSASAYSVPDVLSLSAVTTLGSVYAGP
jgi:hypothetical protein